MAVLSSARARVSYDALSMLGRSVKSERKRISTHASSQIIGTDGFVSHALVNGISIRYPFDWAQQ